MEYTTNNTINLNLNLLSLKVESKSETEEIINKNQCIY